MAASSAKKLVKSGWSHAVAAFFDYDTPKIVHIRSKKVGFINRFLQIIVIAYIALYVIWWDKGYQETDTAVSATTTKLKGVSLTNYSQLNITIAGGVNGTRIWDVADYVVPPQENDAFFVMTNVIITPQQTQGICPEDVQLSKCSSDDDCMANYPVAGGNGVMTGRCVHKTSSCEIYAWCPVENDELPLANRAMLEDSQKFTVLIKNYIEFPKFHHKRRNILDSQDSSYLKTCRYNSQSKVDRLCPIFGIGDIVAEAQRTDVNATYDSIAIKGGVIVISIDWNCNLDYSIDDCLPEYTFSRLDDAKDKIAKGSNFRYASMYEKDGILTRDLFKAFGIRFIIKVTGTAGKFSIVPLLLNIGSGIGLLAVATVICDIIILYVLKKRKVYKEKKYLNVHAEDAYNPQNDDDDDDDDVTRSTNSQQQQGTAARGSRVLGAARDDDDVALLGN
jgi:P2X purinoceptor 4